MLKVGTETGSVMNHIRSRAVNGQPTPEVGMGATLLMWTDRHAATIVEVTGDGPGMMIKVQEDTSTRIDLNGLSESSQAYEHTRNPAGVTYHFRMAPNGFWQRVSFNEKTKRWNKVKGTPGIQIGFRETYWDPCF